MKKAILGLTCAALTAAGVWAQSTPAPVWTLPTVPGFQAGPRSAVKDVTSTRYNLDEDNYLDVINWRNVNYDKYYFFLGGVNATRGDSGIQSGFATKVFGGHLGLFFNGNLFKGSGSDSGSDDSDDNIKKSGSEWSNELGILFANETIGGIRFDLLLGTSTTPFTTSTEIDAVNVGDGKYIKNEGNIITSLQWGKNLGAVSPKVLVGFKWPTYELSDDLGNDVKTETWKNAELSVKLEAALKAIPLSADNQFTVDFGQTIKSSSFDTKVTGWIRDTLNVYYAVKGQVDEKLSYTLRPQLQFNVAAQENKTTISNDGGDDVVSYSGAPNFWFSFAPMVEMGVKYQVNSKLALYTGLKVTLLTLTTDSQSTYEDDTDPANKSDDKPFFYKVDPLTLSGLGTDNVLKFGGSFAFSPAFSVNASLTSSILSIGMPGAKNAKTSVTNPFVDGAQWLTAAQVVFSFKPQAKKPPAAPPAAE